MDSRFCIETACPNLQAHAPTQDVPPKNAKTNLLSKPNQKAFSSCPAKGFCAVARELGLEQDVMQPTMMRSAKPGEGKSKRGLYLTTHIDDLLVALPQVHGEQVVED